MQKIKCPSCGNEIWDFEVQEYYQDNKIKFICYMCPLTQELIDLLDCRR